MTEGLQSSMLELSTTAKASMAVETVKTTSSTAVASKSIVPIASQATVERLIVCGSGLAGYSAIIATRTSNTSPLLITGSTPGGVLASPGSIEYWPGAAPTAQPHELATALHFQVASLGTRFMFDSVVSIDTSVQPYAITTKKGKLLYASAVIIATGLTPKTLNLKGEASLLGRSVFTSAAFVVNFPPYAAVVGNDSTAVAEALALSTKVRRVTLVCNAPQLSCAPSLALKLKQTFNVLVKYNVTVSDYNVSSSGELRGLCLVHPLGLIVLDVFLVVLALGSQPKVNLLPPEAKTANGFVKEHFEEQNLSGIFAAGSILESTSNQQIMISASGFTAATNAIQYINSFQSKLALAHFEFARTIQHESAKVATALISDGVERFSSKTLNDTSQVTKTLSKRSESAPSEQLTSTTPLSEGKKGRTTVKRSSSAPCGPFQTIAKPLSEETAKPKLTQPKLAKVIKSN
ncbi:MAG: NAD(P)/FAD-dependent oxidoreductase [Candidatus Hodgkinia cicadicola]